MGCDDTTHNFPSAHEFSSITCNDRSRLRGLYSYSESEVDVNIRENLNANLSDKLTGIALILQSSRELVVWSLITTTIGLSAAIWWLRAWLDLIASCLFWLLLLALMFHIFKVGYTTYHSMIKAREEHRKLHLANEEKFVKLERERAKLDLDRYMPRVLEAGLLSGRNISYGPKGEITVSDYRSNAHQFIEASEVSTPMQLAGPFERISIAECAASVEPNSLKVCVGTIADTGEKAIISFKKSHFKFIGASQKGKSSLVASFLDAVSQTHTPDVVQFSILDMEDMTGNLFTYLPHVRMHARTKEDVVVALRECVAIMEERYTHTVKEIAHMPILLIYVEEFLDLKNQLKAFNPEAYKEVSAHITTLALRGLKARCQLLLCAQADYRDKSGDLAGAMSSIPNGFSVCLKPDASRAAGFTDTALLNRNYQENKVGVFVAQTPTLKAIVIGPDCDLEKRLVELEQEELADTEEGTGIYLLPQPEDADDADIQPSALPVMRSKGPTADSIDLNEAVSHWNSGYDSQYGLMKCYPGMTQYQANKLMKKLKGLADRSTDCLQTV